jgi:hypothetical protein
MWPKHSYVGQALSPANSMSAPLPVITRWLRCSAARQANLMLGWTGKTFWQDESFDHRVGDEAELDRLPECRSSSGRLSIRLPQACVATLRTK